MPKKSPKNGKTEELPILVNIRIMMKLAALRFFNFATLFLLLGSTSHLLLAERVKKSHLVPKEMLQKLNEILFHDLIW